MDESTILREGCGTILLPDVTLLELVGADALEWLQGQVTNDVRPLGEGQPVSFCLCQPTGQIVSVIDAWPGVGRILLACPRETKQGVLDRVEQMVIMEEVEAKDLSSTQMLISLQGRKASLSEPGLPSDRCGFGGVDIWIDRDDKAAIERLLSEYPPISPSAFNSARLEAGIPFWGVDMGPRTLPPEMGKHFEVRHVSYAKGCYVGQEVLHRIFSRGHTNKTWVGMIGDGPLEPGAVLSHPDRPDIGTVSSVALSPTMGNIGAGTIRNEYSEPGTRLRAETERGEVEVEIWPMPLRERGYTST